VPGVYFCETIVNEKIAGGLFDITVFCDELASTARAGQFVSIRCGDGVLLRRPVSICSVRRGTVRFVFEVRGYGTRWLSNCKTGDKIDVLGPLGNGFLQPEGDFLVVGGGIGVPPLLFAAEAAKGGATAVLGFRDSGRVILKSDFEAVCNDVHIATDDGSFGIHGTVVKPLEGLLDSGAFEAVLACGPRDMLQGVAGLCERYSVPCQLSMEERMGCGVGACLVCACETVVDGDVFMSRVCKDGPVFDAREVVWREAT